MTTTLENDCKIGQVQLATFYVADMLLGLPIAYVQEINRNLDLTEIPQAPEHIRGVINLRGDVASVIDLRCILGFGRSEVTNRSRNLILRSNEESIGLWVDQIADIITIPSDAIDSPPANLSGAEGKFFHGVYRTDDSIVVILDAEMIMEAE